LYWCVRRNFFGIGHIICTNCLGSVL